MASRIMHLAVADALVNTNGFLSGEEAKKWFLFGSLLPDASSTKASHFPKYMPDDNGAEIWKTFDLSAFRKLYGEKLQTDPLYLGYYLHLVQDIVFRKIMYGETDYDPHVPGNIPLLYEDYRTVGGWIIRTRRLTLPDVPDIPENLEREQKLLGRFPFRLAEFEEELKKDFLISGPDEAETKETHFLHRGTTERFVNESVDLCQTEIRWMLGKESVHLDEDAFRWRAESGKSPNTSLNNR